MDSYLHEWQGGQKDKAVTTAITERKGAKKITYTYCCYISVCMDALRDALTCNVNEECFHYDPLTLRVDFLPGSRWIRK